jgi:hypothetical protein
MDNILTRIYENIKFNRNNKEQRLVQEYNLEQYLRTVCDIKGRL